MRPIIATLAAAALVAVPATVTAATVDPPGSESDPPTWNAREHEAHRPSSGPAGRAVVTSPCAAAFSQAWEELGHFSDAMETWMLTTDTCRPAPPSAPSASRWSGKPV